MPAGFEVAFNVFKKLLNEKNRSRVNSAHKSSSPHAR
jgi:hypothetical protein